MKSRMSLAERRRRVYEIVEIGAVTLTRKFEIVDRFEELIKPQIYRSMHFMTSKIIHLEKEELEKLMYDTAARG